MSEGVFKAFGKIPRLNREVIITEKLDGTNGQIHIEPARGDNGTGQAGELLDPLAHYVDIGGEPYKIKAGSRNRYLTPDKDNFGFCAWVFAHAEELVQGLGVGRHFGEWWGAGIQRRYGLATKRFSLFNVSKWSKNPMLITPATIDPPACCDVVPVLYVGPFRTWAVESALDRLIVGGSVAAPGFMDPEGIVLFHTAAGTLFKATCKDDDKPKGGDQ